MTMRLLLSCLAALGLVAAAGAGTALATGSPGGTLGALGLALPVGLWGLWRGMRPVLEALQRLEPLSGQLQAAREDLLQRERLLRAVVDSAPMAIVLYSDSGRIAFTNSDARELFFEGRA
ncbi:MAG TPA: hypothetical protein VF815_45965, partial [Myxococcaceae bacterium]